MTRKLLFLSIAAFGAAPAIAADPANIDWLKVPAATVPLFYPGQSSYEWLLSDAHKGAVKEVKRGDSCTSCHDEEGAEKDIGEKIVKGGRLEPTPPKGKNGHVDLKVQAAYDDKNAYLRFQWKTNGSGPGVHYPGYRYDGKEWKAYGGPRLKADVIAGKTPPAYEDRMSVMIDDGKVPGFAQQGCWLTCHDGERDLKPASKEDVAANALMKAIKKSDVRKFLPGSRTDPGDWKSGKSLDEIAKLKAAGEFVDLIQWRAHRSNPVGGTDDGYVLEYRNFDQGKNHFSSNMDKDTKAPKYMFDATKFGARSLTDADFGKKEAIMVKGGNAVPFDGGAGWKEGDILPQYVMSAADAAGSAADNKGAGSWKGGMWTVVITRPLGLANADDKALRAGGIYNVGFAVHDDNITSRGHHVSFVKTLGLGVASGTKVDINAVKVK